MSGMGLALSERIEQSAEREVGGPLASRLTAGALRLAIRPRFLEWETSRIVVLRFWLN